MKQIDETMFVSGQIMPDDVPVLAARGVTMIINNRPDGEAPGQPESEEIEAAAVESGIAYRHIPVAGLSREAIDAMEAALGATNGTVLAFCTSGTRSTYLWALARSSMGVDRDTLISAAATAGYDLSPIERFLR